MYRKILPFLFKMMAGFIPMKQFTKFENENITKKKKIHVHIETYKVVQK